MFEINSVYLPINDLHVYRARDISLSLCSSASSNSKTFWTNDIDTGPPTTSAIV